MMQITEKISTFGHRFWHADMTNKNPMARAGYDFIFIVLAVLRDLKSGQISLRAMSLVYTTLITLVPLLAFSFSVLKGFNVHHRIEPMMQGMFEGLGPEKSAEVTEKVVGFVDNIQVGVLGVVGLALLLYAVISLMQKIEGAFNFVWRVQKSRSLARRFGDYLSVIFVGPLLLFLSAGLSTAAGNSDVVLWLTQAGHIGWLFDLISILIPWFIMAMGFAFIYSFIPNTKVTLKAAFIGGLTTAFCWKFMGWGFSTFIAGSASYVAIYAAFATLIIFMIWLYLSWLVVLVGANISYYAQNPAYARIARGDLKLSGQDKIEIGCAIITLIGRAFYHDKPIPNEDDLSKQINAPILAVQHVLDILENGGMIALSGEKLDHYLPARPFDKVDMAQLINLLLNDGHHKTQYHLPDTAKNAIADLSNDIIKTYGKNTILKQLINGH